MNMEDSINLNIWRLYKHMLRSRLFEQAVIQYWSDGKISGEMHMGLGEEAIVAGILDHFKDGDSMALDHRGTPAMVIGGIDLGALLREFLGDQAGLCGGKGGHMHLFSKERLAASSGIVGAAGPTACGFAVAAKYLRPGSISVAFFGDGAVNQGMLLESFNLSVAWNLPILFVCKDSEWAITTISSSVTGGNLVERANGFGMNAVEIDGSDVETVWESVKEPIKNAREKNEPSFIHAHCYHSEGHFLGDPLLQVARNPLGEMKKMAGSMIKSITKIKGASLKERTNTLSSISSLIGKTAKERRVPGKDPLEITRNKLLHDESKLNQIEQEVQAEIKAVIDDVMIL